MKKKYMNSEFPWHLKKTPLGAAYQHFANAAKQKTVLDAERKELIRLSIASVFRCSHCTESHIKNCLEAGATKTEISDALLLSSLQSAGTELHWSKELFEKYLGEYIK
jgi:AhpD family alkylhydroperoxidase